ncbi:regulatory protein RecX [Actinorhabdospora filicis]|uniref:Regulatory protein RecX n=1 Tax=Actinorhabdospora filicis TaxID=1785913 RepID=A0A9W6SND1_9ACTN|nr:regulatory protein RecX [Actinorhabdospora filicis]GLZ79062.1 regulatory protein RecX [Actinorhabdospora filicis]
MAFGNSAGRGGGRGKWNKRRDDDGDEAERAPRDPAKEAERAREICLRLLSARPRTHAELTEALTKREIPEEVVTEVLERYTEVGIIDDAAFAGAWVTSRHRGKGLARRALSEELRRKGVDREVSALALEQLDEGDEREMAAALVARKLKGFSPSVENDARVRRLVGMLARKGYPPGMAMSVVREAIANEDLDLAED